MNEIVHRFLLAGDKFMPEMNLRQVRFTNRACCPFINKKERIEKFMQTANTNYIHKMILIKLVFNMIRLMVNRRFD